MEARTTETHIGVVRFTSPFRVQGRAARARSVPCDSATALATDGVDAASVAPRPGHADVAWLHTRLLRLRPSASPQHLRQTPVAAPRRPPSCLPSGRPSTRSGARTHTVPRAGRAARCPAGVLRCPTAWAVSAPIARAARSVAHAVSHTGLEPQTGRSQTGLLLTRASLALDRAVAGHCGRSARPAVC